jgi:hypothetical protein
MANTNSDLATAQAAAYRDPSAAPKPGLTSGIMFYLRGQVTCPATPTVADTLTLIPAEMLPVGAVYEPAESWLWLESDPGTALTLDIGPVSNPDALADALALTATGVGAAPIRFCASATAPAAMLDPLAITEQEAILATVMVSTAVDATVIQFQIAFRIIG